ncbi:hypothetical protein Val02_47690 [Virgisporangium aliadipatigenens]|uniref:Uncharacterized protein n=1 Tax=Virgisporangium aliadipatigenens TaxID=741659 RepID=A0A8J3YPG0_9ACTN|nr:hypothetical protein [Virgisporangium aliadipatigenens]GIJ47883.1 hypothetical protein Val02_47690 [Virgisporangium aliadipatigenens]
MPKPGTVVDVGFPVDLWAGTVATAMVAGLVALTGTVAARAAGDVRIIAPAAHGGYLVASPLRLTAAALVATAGAALLMHLLLVLSPQPFLFFGWVSVLMTTLITLWPFTTSADVPAQAATALVYLAIGGCVTGLTASVARESRWSWRYRE